MSGRGGATLVVMLLLASGWFAGYATNQIYPNNGGVDDSVCRFNAAFAYGMGLVLYNETSTVANTLGYGVEEPEDDWTGEQCAQEVRAWAESVGYAVWLPPCAFPDYDGEEVDCNSYAQRQIVDEVKS